MREVHPQETICSLGPRFAHASLLDLLGSALAIVLAKVHNGQWIWIKPRKGRVRIWLLVLLPSLPHSWSSLLLAPSPPRCANSPPPPHLCVIVPVVMGIPVPLQLLTTSIGNQANSLQHVLFVTARNHILLQWLPKCLGLDHLSPWSKDASRMLYEAERSSNRPG